jgi:hypothetical protein
MYEKRIKSSASKAAHQKQRGKCSAANAARQMQRGNDKIQKATYPYWGFTI